MRRRRKFRGVSLGTIFMLVLTLTVCGGTSYVFSRLMGDAVVTVDSNQVLEALNLSEVLPHLALTQYRQPQQTAPVSDIPFVTQPPVMASSEPTMLLAQALPTPVITAPPQSSASFTLTFGGSVNVDEAVFHSAYYPDSGKYDFSDFLSLVAEELQQSDLTVLSLENLVMPDRKISTLVAPADIMDALTDVGVDVVALGHSKTYEKGLEGVVSTLQAAREVGLETIGAYESEADRRRSHLITVNGVQLALLHYTEDLTSTGDSLIKKDGQTFAVPLAKEEIILADIAQAREMGAQVIVVSLNWGTSGKAVPTKAQTALAQKLADAGVDVIVGSGTLVVQPVVWLTGRRPDGSPKQTLCAYSLGSLLNESRKDGNVYSLMLQLTISCDGRGNVSFTRTAYTPTYIWRYKMDNKYYYRVVASDQEAPYGMSDDQNTYKEKALSNLQKRIADSPLTLR